MGRPQPWEFCKDQLVVLANHRDAATLAQIRAAEPREVLVLSRRADRKFGRQSDVTYWAPYRSSSSLGKSNNAEIAVLSGRACFALRKRRFFRSFKKVVIGSVAGWICAVPGLLRYGLRGDLKFAGILRDPARRSFGLPLLIFENCRYGEVETQRLFAPPDLDSREILRMLSGIDYVLLRWPDKVDRDDPLSDIDILVSDTDLDRVKDVFSKRLGLFPIDVYSESGGGGHSFKSAPYYPPRGARQLLAQAMLRPSGIKCLAGDAAYLAFAYHLLFHKTDATVVGTEVLTATTWSSTRSFEELINLARAAKRREPRTFTQLEQDLAAADMMPPLDTIGFYSRGNKFLINRYIRAKFRPGLSVFLVRDFGITPEPLTEVRKRLVEEGFEIAAEGKINEHSHKSAIESIRGGNWYDKYATSHLALPKYFFVCRNDRPVKPSKRTLARHPRVDDESVMVKMRIRDDFTKRGMATTRLIHASDNSAEAWEYVRALGLEEIVAQPNVTSTA